MCARNEYGGKTVDSLNLVEWSEKEASLVFDRRFTNLKNILFCGTHGDPATATDCLQLVKSALKVAAVEFYTNGSVRPQQWWSQLGEALKGSNGEQGKKSLAVFSIDGLSDTNHLYRRNTNFDKIMENAEAFIQSGGHARWDFIVFKHNEHQVEEAQSLAKKMGFKQFRIRKTSRFAYSPDGPDKHRVQNRHGDIEYFLEPPTNSLYINSTKKTFEKIIKNEQSCQKPSTEIRCLNKSTFQRLYVNAALEVFPCCFISRDNISPKSLLFKDLFKKVHKKYQKNFNSLRHHSWADILQHPFFKRDLLLSWKANETQLLRCQRTCSVKVDPITSQSENQSL